MNDIIASVAVYSLLTLPPALLILKFTTKKPGWWLIVLLVAIFVLVGWGLVFSAFVEEQARISEIIDQERYEELPEGWGSDGASGVFALFGGWLVPLAYFVLLLSFIGPTYLPTHLPANLPAYLPGCLALPAYSPAYASYLAGRC